VLDQYNMTIGEVNSRTDSDFRFRGRCAHAEDAIDLTRYPNLTYAPLQWGEGVRTSTNGVAVAEIAVAATAFSVTSELDRLAYGLGISLDELLDAIRYARAQGQV
jgi:hypothetical protein